MSDIQLHIGDLALKFTVQALLKARGHRIVEKGEVAIADSARQAVTLAGTKPALILATASTIPDAVAAMHKGVYGYVFLPLQPGELEIMVARALGASPAIVRDTESSMTGSDSIESLEREHVLAVLRACKNNRTEAARRLGIGRNTLWRKLRAYETAQAEEAERKQR